MLKRTLIALCAARALTAQQIPEREFAARRDSLAARIDSGVVDRVRRADAGDRLRPVPPTAGVSLSHELRRARRRVGDGRARRRRLDDALPHAGRTRDRPSTTDGAPTRRRSRRDSRRATRARSRRWPGVRSTRSRPTGLAVLHARRFRGRGFRARGFADARARVHAQR